MRYLLLLCILPVVLNPSTGIADEDRVIHLAQAGQTVQPAPLPQLLPSTSTSTACVISCDTAAMNCLSACVPTTPAVTTTTSAPGACNLACTTQQLVCKQGCTR